MMDENIFMKEKKPISFEDYLEYHENSRGNLGGELPVIVYRLLEYSIKDELPVLGETVCNYDEGFISGILSLYSGKEYVAVETDCWATGGRVCRFQADVREGGI